MDDSPDKVTFSLVLVHSGADLYGASRSVLRLATRLVQDGHTTSVILPYEGPLSLALRNAGVVVRVERSLCILTRQGTMSLRGILGLMIRLPLSIIRLFRLFREAAPDLIHTNTAVIVSSCLAARLVGVPHLCHVRESFGEFGLFWPIYQRFLSATSTRLLCVSAAVERQFTPRIRARKTIVLHNGIPLSEVSLPAAAALASFRSTYGLNDKRIVGVVGRIKLVRKGQEIVARAAALLKDRIPDARYIFVGSPFPGNEHHLLHLKALIRDLKIEDLMVFVGDCQDMPVVYAVLDVLVLPSGQPEPFGGVVLEAMAYGKPVVGTRIGGTVEQIDDGRTGYLIPPGDPAALADALARLLGDPATCKRLGQQARKKFVSEFDYEKFITRLYRIYRNTVPPELVPPPPPSNHLPTGRV